MGFKDLFVSSGIEKPEESTPVKVASFPTQASTTFPSPTVTTFAAPVAPPATNNYSEEIMGLYIKGFESLNQPGVEFYEFYKAVEAVDINNTQAYKMALAMLQNVDKSFSKEKALSSSQHYIDNILVAHKEFLANGTAKKDKLTQDKTNEASSLNVEIASIEKQLEALSQQLGQKKIQLSSIDAKYDTSFREVDGKLQANEAAKDTMINRIRTVIENIKITL